MKIEWEKMAREMKLGQMLRALMACGGVAFELACLGSFTGAAARFRGNGNGVTQLKKHSEFSTFSAIKLA